MDLLDRLFNSNAELVPERLSECADLLVKRARETGLAAPLIVAETLNRVSAVLLATSPGTAAFTSIGQLIRDGIKDIQAGDPLRATERAFVLSAEVASALSLLGE